MNSVPEAFIEAVAGCVYNNRRIKSEQLKGAWKTAFAAQKQRREVYGLFLRPKRDSDFFEYKFIRAKAQDEREYDWESAAFVEELQDKRKYVRVNQIKLMLENDKTIKNWRKVPNIDVFEMLVKFAVSQISSENWKNTLHLQIEDNRRDFGLALLRNINHCEFWSLTMDYIGPESESFLKERLRSKHLSSLHLIGKWPSTFGKDIVDFFEAIADKGQHFLPDLRVDSASEIMFDEAFHWALTGYFTDGRFRSRGIDIGIRYPEETIQRMLENKDEQMTCSMDAIPTFFRARSVGDGVVLYEIERDLQSSDL
uniref:AGPT-Pplase3 domain-containing protein n=1 Tax=Steinernema glaseri TaxID=37863 RepID=A0A1I8A9J4_9BILA